MVKIISFGSNRKSSKDSEDFFFIALLKSLWNLFSSQDNFTKFFIITALIIAIVSPNFVAKYFIRAVSPSPSVDLEGETLTFSGPVISGTDSLASNGGYILFNTYSSTVSTVPCVTLPPEGAGVASGEIIIPKDNYYFVWSRLRGEGDGANSYYLQIDNNCLINVGDQNGMSSNTWTWINYQNGDPSALITSNLTAGTHTIRLIGREAKTSLDKLIFTYDTNCSPIDTGENCLPQPTTQAEASALTVTPTPISGKTASILVSPSSGAFVPGQTFSIDLKVDGGGQAFNAAQAKLSISNNIQVKSLAITPGDSGGCNFLWANQNKTPTVNDPSFAGAILKSSSLGCTVYTLTLQALSDGIGTVTFVAGSVKSYTTHQEILGSLISGSYTFGVLPTATPTLTPTSSPIPTPTLTPIPTTPIPTFTVTPIPPTPTSITLQAPIIDNQPLDTYSISLALTGTRMVELITIYINGSSAGVIYPTSTTWSGSVSLVVGPNTFQVYGKDIDGNQSPSSNITIVNHILADINGDGIVDLTDLSMFGTDFENTGTLNYALSDMDGDGIVDLTDFSIIAKEYNGI